MATKFVRVTTPSVLFDLWVAGLLYVHCEGIEQHCRYSSSADVDADRAYYLPYWERGEGISFDDQYGYMAEE